MAGNLQVGQQWECLIWEINGGKSAGGTTMAMFNMGKWTQNRSLILPNK